jgi:hypothetical protein
MKTIKMVDHTGSFASNKDVAKYLRENVVIPKLLANEPIVLDFEDVTGATQSFIHALISEAMRQVGSENTLNLISFKSCNEKIQAIITIVTDYMQAGLDS